VLSVLEELAIVRLNKGGDASLAVSLVDEVDLSVLLELLPRNENFLVALLLGFFLGRRCFLALGF